MGRQEEGEGREGGGEREEGGGGERGEGGVEGRGEGGERREGVEGSSYLTESKSECIFVDLEPPE